MNKKKFFKKYGAFLGIASAIVAIPTISSVVTANKTTVTQNVSNSINDSKTPSINNYENGGTKNNETMNFDDILNGVNKASFENPVFTFSENNELVVPNINDDLINSLSSVENLNNSWNELKKTC